jgi:hypothetical protein
MITVSQKRTCYGCRAFIESCRLCEIGYSIKVVKVSDLFSKAVPAEKCSKPRTGSDWIEARRFYQKR